MLTLELSSKPCCASIQPRRAAGDAVDILLTEFGGVGAAEWRASTKQCKQKAKTKECRKFIHPFRNWIHA